MNSFVRLVRGFAFAVAALLASAQLAFAQTTSTIPDIGVDATTYVTDFGTKVGTYLGAVVGLALIIYAVKLAVRWIRHMAK